MATAQPLKLTWLGHSTFLMDTPAGKRVIIDPWVMGNPVCPDAHKAPDRLDVMLITHGHFDHIGDAVELGKRLGPHVVAIFETCNWLERKGVGNLVAMNKGGTVEVAGLRVTMVHAVHSCGIQDDDGSIIYGGEACGFVIELEDGFRLYHAGDTALHSDMFLIGELFRPDVALLPIGDRFVMDPRQAARAAQMLGVRRVVPMHHGTFPLLTGTPAQLRDHLQPHGIEVFDLSPGGSVELRRLPA